MIMEDLLSGKSLYTQIDEKIIFNQLGLSYFDTGKNPSEATEPERFYHGFVLGLMVDLAGRYSITSGSSRKLLPLQMFI